MAILTTVRWIWMTRIIGAEYGNFDQRFWTRMCRQCLWMRMGRTIETIFSIDRSTDIPTDLLFTHSLWLCVCAWSLIVVDALWSLMMLWESSMAIESERALLSRCTIWRSEDSRLVAIKAIFTKHIECWSNKKISKLIRCTMMLSPSDLIWCAFCVVHPLFFFVSPPFLGFLVPHILRQVVWPFLWFSKFRCPSPLRFHPFCLWFHVYL